MARPPKRKYYSSREGVEGLKSSFDLSDLRRHFFSTFKELDSLDYCNEHFGTHCVDVGNISGTLGTDIKGAILLILKRQNVCLLYTSPSPRDRQKSRMPSSA